MVEISKPLFGALEADRFFDRETEQDLLQRMARDLSRGWGKSVFVCAPAGAGKTELLKQVYSTLYRDEGNLVPFYYTFPRLDWELKDFAVDFAGRLAAQFLAFKRQYPRDTLVYVSGPIRRKRSVANRIG